MLGHTVGGQQQAGHLEATLSEDHLLGSNGEAASVQAGHLHAGDGAGILIGVQLDRVSLHDEPHVLALLDPAADAFGERGLRAGHVQLGLQGVVLEVQQLALIGDPRGHLQRVDAGFPQLERPQIVRVHRVVIDGPATVRHPVALLEVDGIEGGQVAVLRAMDLHVPLHRGAAEAPVMRPDDVGVEVGRVFGDTGRQLLGGCVGLFAAGFQQDDIEATVQQFLGSSKAGRAGPDDADVGVQRLLIRDGVWGDKHRGLSMAVGEATIIGSRY